MARRTSPRVTTSIFDTIGECTGKVRSTPTPKLTLRTVNVSRMPLPLRRITTPWNTCVRSRLPSTTRTCTFSVSPGANSGMSLRSWVRSTRSVAFIEEGSGSRGNPAMLPARPRRPGTRAAAPLPPAVSDPAGEEVGAPLERAAQRLRPPPAGDPGVVAAQQHLGHRVAAELGRPGVLRVLEAGRRRTTRRRPTPRCP